MNRPISAVGGALTRNDKWGSVPGKPEVDEGGISLKKVACIFLAIFLLTGCTGCAAVISHPAGTAVRICYDCEHVSFDLELPKEEAGVVLSVLNGKRRDLDMSVTGAGCGFGQEQSFIIDGSIYCLAQDSCSVIWEEGTDNYYRVTDQEMKQLKEIFNVHGAKIK